MPFKPKKRLRVSWTQRQPGTSDLFLGTIWQNWPQLHYGLKTEQRKSGEPIKAMGSAKRVPPNEILGIPSWHHTWSFNICRLHLPHLQRFFMIFSAFRIGAVSGWLRPCIACCFVLWKIKATLTENTLSHQGTKELCPMQCELDSLTVSKWS